MTAVTAVTHSKPDLNDHNASCDMPRMINMLFNAYLINSFVATQ